MNAYQKGQKFLCGDYSSYTPTGAGYFKKAGRWYTIPAYGDVAYFYNSALGRIGHVGIVTSVDTNAKTFTTVEGNTSSVYFTTNGGSVATHTYSYAKVGGTNRVQGFGRPLYSSDSCSAQQFVEYALTWVGYEEKKSNGTEAQLTDKHWNPGENNYTIFGKWYGLNPAQWCQMFVSYCAYQACLLVTSGVSGWKQEDGHWLYYVAGKPVKDAWREIGGRWYVFNGAGHMITGWFKSEEGYYYLNPADGAMVSSQWVQDPKFPNLWSYMTKSGLMATDSYIKNRNPVPYPLYYFVDDEGVWDSTKDTNKPYLELYEIVE